MSNPAKYLLQHAAPLDWSECGSTITAIVSKPELAQSEYGKKLWHAQFNSSVRLTDCSRSIEWLFGTSDDGGPNVAKAEEFQAFAIKFAAAIRKARAAYDKVQAEVKLRNEREGRTE